LVLRVGRKRRIFAEGPTFELREERLRPLRRGNLCSHLSLVSEREAGWGGGMFGSDLEAGRGGTGRVRPPSTQGLEVGFETW